MIEEDRKIGSAVDESEKDLSANTNSSSDPNEAISRRGFISGGLSAASSLLLANQLGGIDVIAAGASSTKKKVDAQSLINDFKFAGKVFTPADKDFERAAVGTLWNELQPARRPQIVARVSSEDDVVAAVKFARANKLRVAVRGGGHNWCAPSLRNSGIMIDLQDLNKVISIDPVARKAVVQPILSNREIQAALNAQGMSYPSGHCPPVKLSGYLLSGGMAWNQGVWGPGVGSIEAIEMVTPQGEKITASKDENQDYFWAARGAGPGMFSVCTRYHLKLYPLPKAITCSSYCYPYEDAEKVAEWLGPLASKLPPSVELSLWLLTAPPELQEKAQSSNGKISMVTATMFADTPEEAKAALAMLDSYPGIDRCLQKTLAKPAVFEELFDASGKLWPDNLRNKVDACFSDAPASTLIKAVKDHYLLSKSPLSLVMFALFTGPNVPAPLLDTAFSMTAKIYGGPWTMWDKVEDDKEIIAWHEKLVDLMKPHLVGHYVSETDTVAHPEYVKASYKAANLTRINELRKKYDPEGVFFDYYDGLS